MNVVDSSGWLEYFASGPNADFFAPAIEKLSELVVPSISLYEVFKRVLQQRGEESALQAIAAMQQGHSVDLDAATARAYGATLWTQDADLGSIEGVQYINKP